MTNVRVIARLDVKGENVINTIQLEGLRVVGKPNELALKYCKQQVDEILIIDQVASLYQRGHLIELTRDFARDIFIPITVGGGISKLEDARALLRAGADKIAINTAVTKNPELISELAREFGRQCIVVSIQSKRIGDGIWEAYCDGGRERTNLDVISWSKAAVELGAGELLVTSIDRDGTRRGYDVELLSRVSSVVNVPIIASGGLGKPSHATDLMRSSACEAVAIADYLHMERGEGTPAIKAALSEAGMIVRGVGK